MSKILKAIEMSNVKIDFLSTVAKGANLRSWVVAKSKDGKKQAKIHTEGRIIKSTDTFGIEVPEGSHLIVGPVYEPMVEDFHGNFMSEAEIKKAAEWFEENGTGSDIQHNEVENEDVKIEKSWILEEDLSTTDFEGNDVVIAKGAWMAAAIVEEGATWDKIQNAELTGWSMGGLGAYSNEEVDLEAVTKSVAENVMSKIQKAVGKILKGTVTDTYNACTKEDAFWNAFWAFETVVHPYVDEYSYGRTWEEDSEKIGEALEEFNTILQSLLITSGNNFTVIAKSLKPTEEAIAEQKIIKSKGDDEMKPEELKIALSEALAPVVKEVEALKDQVASASEVPEEKPTPEVPEEEATPEGEAPKEEDTATVVKEAVEKALEPIMKDITALKSARGISTQASTDTSEAGEPVTKSVFAGMFSK